MSCEYCKNRYANKPLISESVDKYGLEAQIYSIGNADVPEISIVINNLSSTSLKINFCPMCGGKLDEEV